MSRGRGRGRGNNHGRYQGTSPTEARARAEAIQGEMRTIQAKMPLAENPEFRQFTQELHQRMVNIAAKLHHLRHDEYELGRLQGCFVTLEEFVFTRESCEARLNELQTELRSLEEGQARQREESWRPPPPRYRQPQERQP